MIKRSELIAGISAVAAVAAVFFTWTSEQKEAEFRKNEAKIRKETHSNTQRQLFLGQHSEDISEDLCFKLFNNLPKTHKEKIIRKFFSLPGEFREQKQFLFPANSKADLNLCIEGQNPNSDMNMSQALKIRKALIRKLGAYEASFGENQSGLVEPAIVCGTVYVSFKGEPEAFLGYIDDMANPPALFSRTIDESLVESFETSRDFLNGPAGCTGWNNDQ